MLTTTEVATMLNVERQTVALWCKQGRFKTAKKQGRDWVIAKKEAETFTLPKRGKPVR